MSEAESNSTSTGMGRTPKLTNFLQDVYDEEISELDTESERPDSLSIEWDELYEYNEEIANKFADNADDVYTELERAFKRTEQYPDEHDGNLYIRVKGTPNNPRVREIRPTHVGKYVQLDGRVKGATSVKSKVEKAAFECTSCSTINYIYQGIGEWDTPHECDGCGESNFVHNYTESKVCSFQRITLRESQEGLRGGQTPEEVTVYLRGDSTGEITAGDEVSVFGIVVPDRSDESSPVFNQYIDGKEIIQLEEDFEELEISEEEIDYFENELSEQDFDDLMTKMLLSFAPEIYGAQKLKRGLLMSLFGGVDKAANGEGSRRGDIHALLVGDPGTAKSELLKFLSEIAPRSVYSSGKGASSAGLTAAAVRAENFGGGNESWQLRAGALVLADRGIACIDELDKMDDNDRDSMHEALEQQEVNINKAGINATLKSRCALAAAANPELTRFDRYEPLAEQINLDDALISRFDIIFTVVDDMDREEDRQLAEHVLDINEEGADAPIDKETFRKYVSYARTKYHPNIPPNVREIISDAYVELRNSADNDEVRPITARKLDALARLSEAHARMRLSDTVSEQDAQQAIYLVKRMLNEVQTNEDGEYDAAMIDSGMTTNKAEQIKSIKSAFDSLVEVNDDDIVDKEDWLELCQDELNMSKEEFEKEVNKLYESGYVYEPRTNQYKR